MDWGSSPLICSAIGSLLIGLTGIFPLVLLDKNYQGKLYLISQGNAIMSRHWAVCDAVLIHCLLSNKQMRTAFCACMEPAIFKDIHFLENFRYILPDQLVETVRMSYYVSTLIFIELSNVYCHSKNTSVRNL